IQLLPKKTPGPPAGQARPRKTFLVQPWPPARHQAAPRMPPAPKALEMSDKLIDAQAEGFTTLCAMAPPAGFSPKRWRQLIDAAGAFLGHWGRRRNRLRVVRSRRLRLSS